MNENSSGYVSIIGEALLDPIISLIEKAQEGRLAGANEVQTSVYENGYSCSIILLTVVLLESFITRTKYVMGVSNKDINALAFFKQTFEGNSLYDILYELFVIRDIIAHNHVWEGQVLWDEEGLKFNSTPIHHSEGYGDSKFRNSILIDKRVSKRLSLNLFPTRICWEDAKKVLKSAYKVLSFLEEENFQFCYVSNWTVYYKGDYRNFLDVVDNL